MRRYLPILLIAVVLALVFLAFRYSVLVSFLNYLYEEEELYRGTVAREMMSAKPLIPILDYLDYKVEYFPGGTLVVALLAVPLFHFLGQTYVALKLVGLLFALATMVGWFFFMNRNFGRKAAVITGLLFIFCAPFYTKTSLLTWGAHPEANFFTIAALSVLFKIVYEGKGNRWHFILGLICGFGLWFVQTFLITIAFVLAVFFIFDKRLLKRCYAFFAAGCLAGFLPGIVQALFQHEQIFGVNGTLPLMDALVADVNALPYKTLLFAAYDLPNSFLFEDICGVKGVYLSYAYYFLFVAAVVRIIVKNRRGMALMLRNLAYPVTLRPAVTGPSAIPPAVLLILFFAVFAASYIFSGYSVTRSWPDPRIWLDYIGYRYMIPVMPFVFAVIAIWVSSLRARSAACVFCCAAGLGLAGNLSLVRPDNFGRFDHDRGYSYSIIGDKIGLRHGAGVGEYIQPFNRLEPALRDEFYDGLGAGIAWRMRRLPPGEINAFFKREIDRAFHHNLYRGWGALFSPEWPEELVRAKDTAAGIPVEFRWAFYEGLGRNLGIFENAGEHQRMLDIIGTVEPGYRNACYAGWGYALGFECKNHPDFRRQFIARISKEYREYVEKGMLTGMRER